MQHAYIIYILVYTSFINFSVKSVTLLPHTDSASKHALQGYFDALRVELAPRGVIVTVISPGYIDTQLSVNAVRGDGSKHGGESQSPALSSNPITGLSLFLSVTDPSTSRGMAPQWAAQQILSAIALQERELVLAPAHHRIAVYLRLLCPALLQQALQLRSKVT